MIYNYGKNKPIKLKDLKESSKEEVKEILDKFKNYDTALKEWINKKFKGVN